MAYLLWALIAIAVFVILNKRKAKTIFGPAWRINWSKGMPASPIMQGNGWFIDFPNNPAYNVNYIQWYKAPSLVNAKTVTMKFSVVGAANFTPWEDPNSPGLVSLLIQRKGDTGTAQGVYESYRWFSNEAIPLKEGEFELVVPLDAQHWGGVMGSHDEGRFREALKDMESLGVIFGYNGGRGHGVYTDSPSRFNMISLTVA